MEHIVSRDNIILVGIPDHVFEWSDGSVSPIDYKTSRYTKGQDSLKPLYVAQLDAYAHLLAAKCSLESDRGALVYFEPKGPETMELTKDGYTQPWMVSVHPVEVTGELTDELLSKAREIYEQRIPPDGRAECIDCELFEKLVSLAQKQSGNTRDALFRAMTARERIEYVAEAEYRRSTAHLAAPASSSTSADKSSLLVAWDWNE
jgi:CRISPR/Cas system-associated exonuclease Cas4 (RecB family)